MGKKTAPSTESVVVIGLGRFGRAVAESLVQTGHEVLGIDESPEIVQELSHSLTHVVQANTTSVETLRQLGVADFQHGVVAIGSDLESSVLSVLALSELGVPDIWAKAVTERHGKILEKTGAHHVVYPERTMGERVAHLVTSKIIDFIEFDDGFAIAKTRAPVDVLNKTLAESQLRRVYNVTIVGIKRPGEDFSYGRPETLVLPGDLLIVAGPTREVEAFAGKS